MLKTLLNGRNSLVVVLIALLSSGCSLGHLTEKPERKANEVFAPPAGVSKVSLVVTAQSNEVLAVIEQNLPTKFQFHGDWYKYFHGHRQHGNFSFEVTDISWSPIASAPNELTFTAPFRIRAQANVNGLIGAIAGSKNIRANFNTGVKVRWTISDNWCPIFEVESVPVEWLDKEHPKLEIVKDTWIKKLERGMFEAEVRIRAPKIQEELNQRVDCKALLRSLASLWQSNAVPLIAKGEVQQDAKQIAAIQNSNAPLFLNITPVAATLQLPTFERATLRAGIEVEAITTVSPRAIESMPKPLPKAVLKRPDRGEFRFFVPITVPYDLLTEQISNALKLPVVIDVEGRATSIVVRGIEIYPSGNKVVIGLDFKADLPSRLFDTKGQVWISSIPVIDKEAQTLRLDQLAVARKIDHAVWQTLSILLDGLIRQKLTEATRIDMKPLWAFLEKRVSAEVVKFNDKGHGVTATLSGLVFTMQDVQIGNELQVLANAAGEIQLIGDLEALLKKRD